jgi:hypothetical protein
MKTMLRMLTAATVSGVVIALSLSGIARAITDTVFRYSTEKKGYLSIPPSAFLPENSTRSYSTNGHQLTPQGSFTCFFAPAHFPNRANLTALAIWYKRTDAEAIVRLLRHDHYSSSAIIDKTLVATGDTVGVKNFAITSEIVNNAQYAYQVLVCVDVADYLTQVRIAYTYTDAGD